MTLIYRVTAISDTQVCGVLETTDLTLALADFTLKNRILTRFDASELQHSITQNNYGQLRGPKCEMTALLYSNNDAVLRHHVYLEPFEKDLSVDNPILRMSGNRFGSSRYMDTLSVVLARFVHITQGSRALAKILAVVASQDPSSVLWRDTRVHNRMRELNR